MGYGNHDRQTLKHVALTTAKDLTAASDSVIWNILKPVTCLRILAVISTATVSTGTIVVNFDKRITTDSDTGRVTGGVGTLNIPTGVAAGKVYYKDVHVDLQPGDQIATTVTTAAAGGGAAGAAYLEVELVDRDEVAANCTDMVASA